jgi:hypothetical protein
MLLERIGRSARPEIGLSNALYIELVDTLLVEIRGLALTLAATILGAVAVGLTTRDSILWLFAAALVVLGAVRMYYMQAHSRNRPSPNLAPPALASLTILLAQLFSSLFLAFGR